MLRLTSVYDVYAHDRARPGAVSFLYELLQERPEVANISHTQMPTMGQHERFVNDKPYRYWYLIEHQPQPPREDIGFEWLPVGSVSATVENEIGIFILKAFHRRGYARTALEMFLNRHTPLPAQASRRSGRWLANVAMANEASHALFKSLGAKQIQTTYEL